MRTAVNDLPHLPVLYQEIITALRPISGGKYVDATLGAGGHAAGILAASAPDGCLLGFDLDSAALELSKQKLEPYEGRATLLQASYVTLAEQVRLLGWEGVDGIVLDLGVSSMQIDSPERGFSFQKDGPLDMRFGPQVLSSAADLVNRLPEEELAHGIWIFGEEQQSRKIARAICRSRPFHGTLELAEVISRALNWQRGAIHPATRTFQALRIMVNQELAALETVLPQMVDVLSPGGRAAVISFHSLEDRIVKQYFRKESQDCICPPRQPVCMCGHRATVLLANRRPITASTQEVSTNPRSRSARLRVVEKLEMA